MTSADESLPDSGAPFQDLTTQQVLLLRRSAGSLHIHTHRTLAEAIYAQLADVPGAEPFLYDLPARIRSTARFLGVLIALVSADPLDTRRLEREFAMVGRAHARAGLPPVLLDLGGAVFARCMAAAAAHSGRAWTSQDMSAWDALIQTGVEIQKCAYTRASPQEQHTQSAPASSSPPRASSAPETGTSGG